MIDFLGRQAELQLFSDAINTSGQRFIITIVGQGGIGKTRLLQELFARYHASSRAHVLEIIDFDMPAYDLQQVLGRALAREFPADFQPYLATLRLNQQAAQGLLDPSALPAQSLDSDESFVSCFNHATSNRRVVLLFDTVEKAYGRHSFAMLIRSLTHVANIVVVLAGRPANEQSLAASDVATELGRLVDANTQLRTIALPPFDMHYSLEYIQRKQPQAGVDLDPDWQATLAILAAGRPVLIDLAVELGKRIPAADWLREVIANYARLEQLAASADPGDRAEFGLILQRFERELVGDLEHMRSQLVGLTLLLARVAPLDADSAAYILAIDRQQVVQLFSEASRRASFKLVDGRLLALHDVVRDLVNQYIFPLVDDDGERAQTYLTRAIAALERQSQAALVAIKQLQAPAATLTDLATLDALYAQIRAYQQARIRIAEYTFRLDPVRGVGQLEAELQLLRLHGAQLGDLSSLLDVVRENLPALARRAPDQYMRATIMLAGQYMKEERYADARRLYQAIEPQIAKSPDATRYTIARERGAIEMGIGNGLKALEYFQETARLAEKQHNPAQRANALISCAWATRTYGVLIQPEQYYLDAIKLVRSAAIEPEEALRLHAAALNGLSYVYAIEKRLDATELLDQAIDIRRKLGMRGRTALGQSYATAGEVYCELGAPESALAHLELAEEIFKDLDSSQSRQPGPQHEAQPRNQWFGKIYSAQGRAYSALWELATQPEEQQQYLEQAETILLQAVAQAIAADRPRAYQRLGFVYAATPDRRAEAAQAWATGLRHAQTFGDIFNEFNLAGNLALMALYGLYSERLPNDQAFDAWFDDYAERVGRGDSMPFVVLRARFNTYRGCLALRRGDAERAFALLNEGLALLAARKSDLSYSFKWQLALIEQDVLPHCDKAIVRDVMRRLLAEWMHANRSVIVWDTFEHWSS